MSLSKLFAQKPWGARARAAMNIAQRGAASLRSAPQRRAPFRGDDISASHHSISKRLRGILPLAVAAAFFAAAAAIGASHVTLKLRELEAGHALGELHKERAQLAKEQRRLHIELGTLQSPDRIQRLAREKLGLLQPRPSQIGSVPP